MPPTTHKIENAKSGRSKCKRCKETITNGELRIQSNAESETTGMHFTHNYHTSCFKVPPQALKGVSPEDFVKEHLEDCSNDEVLSNPTTLQEVIDDIAITTNGTKKKAATKKKVVPKKKAAKKKRSTTKEDEEEYHPTKEAKKAKAVKSEEVSEEETSDVGEKEENEEASPVVLQQQWVGCESCGKWRKLPDNISPDSLPDEWLCNMNNWDDNHNTCEAPEEEGA